LLAHKPRYAKRIGGGRPGRPASADPNEELWGLIQSRTRWLTRCAGFGEL
jgi:hypothetical protein